MASYAIIQKYTDALNQHFGAKYSICKTEIGYCLLYSGKALSESFIHKYEFEKAVISVYNSLKALFPEIPDTVSDKEAKTKRKIVLLKKRLEDPEKLKRHKELKKKYNENNRDKINARKRERYKDPELNKIYREKQREYISRPEVKAARKISAQKSREKKKALAASIISSVF